MSALIAQLGSSKDWQAIVTVTELPAGKKVLDASGWHARAQAMFNLGLYKQARVTLNTGLKVAPNSSSLLLLDANLLAKEGKPDQAKSRFEAAKAAKAKE
jgi:predicted Zn-dependent protease